MNNLREAFDMLNRVEMSAEYDEYLDTHIYNVRRAFDWIKKNIPEALSEENYFEETAYYGELEDIIDKHDFSKLKKVPDAENYYDLKCEYDAYTDYFYGTKTLEVKEAFDRAWLSHIHENPHHWQHWLLQNDDPEIGLRVLDMPYVFIIEMICDHWSFSWKSGNLYEIFKWYDDNKSGIILSAKTRNTYESLLANIKEKLDSQK